MQLQTPFDATQWNPQQSAGQLPVGKHPVVITDSTVKATAANDGGYLEFTLTVIDGPNQGTTGAYRLNLYNQSQKAVEIAHKQLSAICHCVGIFNIADSSQLHNIPFMVEVGVQKNDSQYTEVKKVFDRNGNEPGKSPAAAQPSPQQQQAPAQQQFAQPTAQPQQVQWAAPTPQQTPAPQQANPAAPPWGQPASPAPGGFVPPTTAAAPPWGQLAR